MAAGSGLSLLDMTYLTLLSAAHVKDWRTSTFSLVDKRAADIPERITQVPWERML